MSWLDGLRHRLRVFGTREQYAREQDEELLAHLELAALQHAHAAPLDARAAARRRLGNLTMIKEELRRVSGFSLMDRLRQDVTLALRGIRRAPGFTAVVVLTIALGVGANGAMFSFLDRIFVRAPSGVAAPSDIRRLYVQAHDWRDKSKLMTYGTFEYKHYESIVAASPASAVAAYETEAVMLGTGDAATAGNAAWVSPNYFSLLGVPLVRGRYFGPDEARVDVPTPVAIISHALWTTKFGGDSAIVGKDIYITKIRYTIIGVAAPAFTGTDLTAVDAFLPLNMEQSGGQMGEPWYRSFNAGFTLLVRIPPGERVEPFLARTTIAYDHTAKIPGFSFDTTAAIIAGPIVEARGPGATQREVAIGLRVAGVALALLLIACANVATLLLVRATRQRREVALRLALGASRGRIYAQSLTESTVLALMGGAAAIGVSWWGGTALRKLLLPTIRWPGGVLDTRVVLATLAMTLLLAALSGIAPVMLARRRTVVDAMKGGARDGAYQRSALRTGLLVVQTALSVVLLIGSGLFVRSLGNVRAIHVGYDVDSVMYAMVGGRDAMDRPLEISAAMAQIGARVASDRAVVGTAFANHAPMSGWTHFQIALPDRDSIPRISGDNPGPATNYVSPSYFATVGMRIVAGRGFTANDSGHVFVVNETMAKTFWPGESALGKCVMLGGKKFGCSYVIGVVSNAHRRRMIEDASMNFYLPARTGTTLVLRVDPRRWTGVAVRVRQELKTLLPSAESFTVQRMTEALDRELRPWRLGASIFVTFGLLALLVAAIGVYSVIAYAVSQRTHEMGVRVALGAQLMDVLRLVVGEGFRVVAIGALLGVGAAFALGKLVASLLYGVTPRDPVVMVGAAVTLVVVGVVASLLPAWRAARVDPVTALRAE